MATLRDREGRELRGAQVEIDIRTLNHRFLDVRLRALGGLQEHVAMLEDAVRKRLQRGRIEVSARIEGVALDAPELDMGRARAALCQLRQLRDEFAPDQPLPLSLLSSVPELFRQGSESSRAPHRDVVLEAVARACDDVDEMRMREGRALARELSGRLEGVRAKVAQVRMAMPTIVAGYRERLRDRLDRLLVDRATQLDPSRLEQEVALLADRSDVAEELARLASHCDQFDEIMQGTGPTHGRKLDFLLQEMGREVNTIGAKVQQPDVTRMVVELETDVERMREQIQNVM